MLPIVDKPVIQYLVEEAVASGIKEIIIVTGRGKRAIEDHFDVSWELESALIKKEEQELLREVRKISRLAEFIYVRQPEPLGDGDAILHAKKILKDEPFVVIFGDSIIDSEVPATKQLIDSFKKTREITIGVTNVTKEEVSSYGIVKPEKASHKIPAGGETFRIAEMVEKPSKEKAPSTLAMVGKYVVTPDIFEALEKVRSERGKVSGSGRKELRLIDGLRKLAEKQDIYGHLLDGTFYDTGDKFGMLKATIHYALKNPELAEKLKKFMKTKF